MIIAYWINGPLQGIGHYNVNGTDWNSGTATSVWMVPGTFDPRA